MVILWSQQLTPFCLPIPEEHIYMLIMAIECQTYDFKFIYFLNYNLRGNPPVCFINNKEWDSTYHFL